MRLLSLPAFNVHQRSALGRQADLSPVSKDRYAAVTRTCSSDQDMRRLVGLPPPTLRHTTHPLCETGK